MTPPPKATNVVFLSSLASSALSHTFCNTSKFLYSSPSGNITVSALMDPSAVIAFRVCCKYKGAIVSFVTTRAVFPGICLRSKSPSSNKLCPIYMGYVRSPKSTSTTSISIFVAIVQEEYLDEDNNAPAAMHPREDTAELQPIPPAKSFDLKPGSPAATALSFLEETFTLILKLPLLFTILTRSPQIAPTHPRGATCGVISKNVCLVERLLIGFVFSF